MRFEVDQENEFIKVYDKDKLVLNKPYFVVKNEHGVKMGRLVVFEEERKLLSTFVRFRPVIPNSPNLTAEFRLKEK